MSDAFATQDWVDDLQAEGLLSETQAVAAIARMRAATPWRLWADRLAAIAGSCLILVGIIFFFAYNWRAMGAWHKFAVVELALVLCVAGAVRRGVDDLFGRLFALAAAVFVGVFLIVYGQVYQTGADPWQLFAAWAALVTPWAIVVRFAPLWALWIVLVDTAVVLVVHETGLDDDTLGWLSMAAVHVVALAVRELLARPDDGDTWLRQFLLVGLLVGVTMPACMFVLWTNAGRAGGAGFIFWLITVIAAWVLFTIRQPDLFSAAMDAFSVCIVIVCALGRIVLPRSDLSGFFVFGVLVVCVFGAAGLALRRAMLRMAAHGRDVS